MIKNQKKKINIRFLSLFLILLISVLILGNIPNKNDNGNNSFIKEDADNSFPTEVNPKLSLPTTSYEWWNNTWNFRIPVEISSTDDQQDAPVELQINFTEYFNDLKIENSWLDKNSIRVVEYESETTYTVIDCEFEPYIRTYDNETNAIGDVIWILNGSTQAGTIREYFIYFNNGSVSQVPDEYVDLRIWHEGFEEYQSGDIESGAGSQDEYPTSGYWEVSNTTSARGRSSLHMWGNCWKAESTGVKFDSDPNVRVTAKMRFDDPTTAREVSGIGFHDDNDTLPNSGGCYNIRGNQAWGSAENYIYRNVSYSASTFFWYTLSYIIHDEYIFYIADDDSYTDRDLYWDDISVWNSSQVVQTVPNHMLSITTGDIEASSLTLKIITKDEMGNAVPNAHIYISNNSQPSINQNHISNEKGEWKFSDIINNAIYNISINYTQLGLDDPKTETVYFYENYQIQKLSSVLTAYLNLTSFEFNVSYKNGDPIQNGFVKLKDGSTDVGKGILNEIGNTTLRWLNDTSISYYYEVFFDYTTLPYQASYINPKMQIVDTTSASKSKPYINVITELYNITFNVTERVDKTEMLGAKLRIYNETDSPITSTPIANISVQSNGLASFVSFRSNYNDWKNYTVITYYGGQNQYFDWEGNQIFNVSYNFSLDSKKLIDLTVDIDKDAYNTTLTLINYTQNATWGNIFSFVFSFKRHGKGEASATLDTPDEIYIQIFDGELDPFTEQIAILNEILQLSPGEFNYSFNSIEYSLIGNTYYFIRFTATYRSYLPDDFEEKILVLPLPASVSLHDYDTLTTATEFSQNFNELINITVRYYSDDTGNPLNGATLVYEWDYDSGTIDPDPLNNGYYTFLIDTGDAGSIGTSIVRISAFYENYSLITDLSFSLHIFPRKTSLNDQTNPFDKSYDIYIGGKRNLTFTLKDYTKNQILGDLDEVFYEPYKKNTAGSYKSLSENPITLISNPDDSYLLDFDTENKNLGTYLLRLTMGKTNYETQKIDITYHIILRRFDADLDAKGLDDDQINIVKGKKVTLTVELADLSEGGIPLIGAEVILEIKADEFEFDEVKPGVYELKFDTDNYEAFFSSRFLTGDIIITKPNYITEEIELTIVVEIEEIFPGIPTFYFVLVIAAIIAVFSALAVYRIIQNQNKNKLITREKLTDCIKLFIKDL